MQQRTARLAAIVGAENVADDGASLDEYAFDHSDAPPGRPVAIVRPGTAAEVQQIVARANETATPLVPVSSGGPHFHGDTVPSVPGAVMLDLRRMDRILRSDRRNRMVVIEPGVTYPQLQAALAEEGMRVTPPLLPRANKSVVASLLERQPTLIPRYNYALPEPLRDCGVVWGSGEVLFTGEAGSGPTSLEAQWQAGFVQAEAKGPAQTDFYRLLTGAQGTMGIVTWASVKCELLPEAHEVGFVTAGSLGELVPLVRAFCLLRLGDELMLFDRGHLGRMLASAGVGADADGLQAWTLVVGFGGRGFRSADRVRVQKEDAAELAGQVGLEVRGELPGVPVGAVDDLLRGVSPAPHWKLAAAGGSADIFFLTTLDKIAGHLGIMRAAAETHGFSADSIGVYIQPQHQGVTHHVEFSLPYDPSHPAARAGAQELADDLAADLIAAGAYFSRPYGAWAQPVYNRDAAARDALRKVKAVFDPAGIMNPGKLCFGAPQRPAPSPRRRPDYGASPTTAPTPCAARAAPTASGSPSTWSRATASPRAAPRSRRASSTPTRRAAS